MNDRNEKSKIRKNLRTALKLRKANLITQEQLQEIAKNALALDITASLEEKMERKSRKVKTLRGKL